MRLLTVFVVALLLGCADEHPASTPGGPDAGDAGDAGTMQCAPGERPLDDGGCQPPGVRPEACGEGFEPDGESGCNPILPAEKCPGGQMAIPGDTVCREVAPCPAGKWGDIPVDENTEFVDGSYAGMDSDGTKDRPWTTIKTAVAAAASGDIVAIAAGKYAEDVKVVSKSIRFWGVCPALVEVAGTAAGFGAFDIETGTTGSEIHTLAITGAVSGLVTSGAKELALDRVWIHDTKRVGIAIEASFGKGNMKIEGSLIERASEHGIFVESVDIVLSRSVVRDTRKGASAEGRGINVQSLKPGVYATAAITSCVFEGNRELSIYVAGSHVTIDAAVVQDSLSNSLDQGGRGLDIVDMPMTENKRSEVTVRGSVLRRNRDIQIAAEGSDLTVESCTVSDALPLESDMSAGAGIMVQDRSSRTNLIVRESVVQRTLAGNVMALGSDALLESVMMRDAAGKASDATFGRGFSLQFGSTAEDRGVGTMRWSIVDGARDFGVAVLGSDLVMEASAVKSTLGNASTGQEGDGIAVVHVFDTSTAVLDGVRVENSKRAGISNFGSSVDIARTTLECNPIHLDAEEFEDPADGFTDSGGVVCGCGETTETCVALSSGLSPPKPVQ